MNKTLTALVTTTLLLISFAQPRGARCFVFEIRFSQRTKCGNRNN